MKMDDGVWGPVRRSHKHSAAALGARATPSMPPTSTPSSISPTGRDGVVVH